MMKLIVFGVGTGLRRLKKVLNNNAQILAYADNDQGKWNKMLDDIEIISPNQILTFEYDFIVVTSQFYDQILEQLSKLNIPQDKIINFFSADVLDFIGSQNIGIYDAEKLSEGRLIINKMERLGRERKLDVADGDYIRYSTLELMADEIGSKKIAGSIAELGVYRGAFARKLNELFYDRRFYLFDTFEGFHEADIKQEQKENFSTPKSDVFSDTSITRVLNSMKFPKQCIIRKGYFPQTAEGIEDHFALVSIDADLFNPTYEGLRYFYPRLIPGGYILVHDYNNRDYRGVRQAVRQFCAETGIGYLPLSDLCGSVAITK